MRSVLWTWVGAMALAGTASAEVSFKTVVDRDWCDDHGWGSSSERYCEVREATWPATGEPIAVDSQPNGGIEVVGWDRNEIRLRVKVVADAPTKAEAKSRAAGVRIETDGVIRAIAPAQAWASFRLEVPRRATLSLTSKNGGLHLRDLAGVVDARTDNGGVHLDRMGGKVVARTTNGGVHVQLSGDAWDGESLDVETSNGGVHLQIPDDYNAHLLTSTVNGGIHAPETLRRQFEGKRLDVELGRGGAPIRIETRNGGLHVN
jgi:putative adhesin